MDRDATIGIERIRDSIGAEAGIGIILGSGFGSFVEDVENKAIIRYEDIPNFPVSSVKGHKGELVSGSISEVNILIFSGRVHYYEGYTMQEICFPVRVMKKLGVETLIITNASGSVNESFAPGEIVVISDHINLMGDNPLRGTTHFQNMTEAYSSKLKRLAHEVSEELGIVLKEGVYCVLNGPSYETPAEIRMMRNMGADLAGMSTIPEVITANSMGLSVLGLSIVTNMAAGISGIPLSHKEVIETTEKASGKFRRLVRGIVVRL